MKLELEMAMFKAKEREKTWKKVYRFNNSVGGGKATINFSIITKEKKEDICSQGNHFDYPWKNKGLQFDGVWMDGLL